MRRLLRRKAVTILAAIVSFTAIPVAGIVATATPAFASVVICNSGGHGYCIGAPNLNNGDPVELTAGGRDINRVDQNFTCCGGYEVFHLQIAAAPSLCLGTTNNPFRVELAACSGGNSNGTNWAMKPIGSGNFNWLATQLIGLLLTSDNTQGDQLRVLNPNPGCTPNCFQKWTN